MKKKRHKLILELIEQYDIGTQDELLILLRDKGYDVTQATVSRDVKELRLLKTLSSGGIYKYSVENFRKQKVKNKSEEESNLLRIYFYCTPLKSVLRSNGRLKEPISIRFPSGSAI